MVMKMMMLTSVSRNHKAHEKDIHLHIKTCMHILFCIHALKPYSICIIALTYLECQEEGRSKKIWF